MDSGLTVNHAHRLDPQESKPVREYGLKELTGQSVYTATWYLWLRARVSERRWETRPGYDEQRQALLQPRVPGCEWQA